MLGRGERNKEVQIVVITTEEPRFGTLNESGTSMEIVIRKIIRKKVTRFN